MLLADSETQAFEITAQLKWGPRKVPRFKQAGFVCVRVFALHRKGEYYPMFSLTK